MNEFEGFVHNYKVIKR